MSSNCNCGSDCSCGSGCNCNSSNVEMVTTGALIISGVAPVKMVFVEKNVEGDQGCSCGDDCSCDPCTC